MILAISTGSIAALNVLGLPAALRKHGSTEFVLLLSKGARRFISDEIARLTGEFDRVFCDETPNSERSPNHMHLARTAQLILVYPASANFIGQAANGLASDLVGTTVLAAHKKPRVVFPSMGGELWDNPTVQKNLGTLTASGFKMYGSDEGILPSPDIAADFVKDLV